MADPWPPADGAPVTIRTNVMRPIAAGDSAIVRHASPTGASNVEGGVVWLEVTGELADAVLLDGGFWATAQDFTTD